MRATPFYVYLAVRQGYFDGELYADPEHLSFQEANGLIRKQTLTQGDADRQKHFKYRIYDSYNENQNAPYSDRHKELENLLNTSNACSCSTIPFPKCISKWQVLNGGATLFFMVFA